MFSVEPAVQRTRHHVGREGDETTLTQRFLFEGDITAGAIGEVLRSSPLVGPDSVFGDRSGEEVESDTTSRRLRGFSPAPGFRFDVELTERDGLVFIASFSQPGARTPFLQGDAVWLLSDATNGAVFDEEINTERAREHGAAPLTGSRRSLRRWLFFRAGHARVMRDATARIAQLVDSD